MREALKSRLQNSGSCLLGFLFGLGFSGTVVLSDAFQSKPQPAAPRVSTITLPTTSKPEPAAVQQHVLKAALALPRSAEGGAAPRSAAVTLNPETIDMLNSLQPTARGDMEEQSLEMGPPIESVVTPISGQSSPVREANNDVTEPVSIPAPAPTGTQESTSLYRLHLASVSKRANIDNAIAQLAALYPALLKDIPIAAQEGSERNINAAFTRIFAGSYNHKQAAVSACNAFKEMGQYCAVMSVSQ